MAQLKCNFFSYSLCYPVDIEVILPSFTSCNMDLPHTHKLPAHFAVLYLLHGHGNDYMAWHRYTSIGRYAEEKRVAVVTFSCANKAYTNAPLGDNYYDFLNHELPEFVETYFPVTSDPAMRYIGGLSMGGYGALLHGLQNPGRYSAIGAFSPAIIDEAFEKKSGLNLPPLPNLYDVTRKALDSGEKLPDLFLCIGAQDFLYEKVTKYHDTFSPVWKGSRLRYDDMPGYAHEFAVWDIEVASFLDWIDRDDAFKRLGNNKV